MTQRPAEPTDPGAYVSARLNLSLPRQKFLRFVQIESPVDKPWISEDGTTWAWSELLEPVLIRPGHVVWDAPTRMEDVSIAFSELPPQFRYDIDGSEVPLWVGIRALRRAWFESTHADHIGLVDAVEDLKAVVGVLGRPYADEQEIRQVISEALPWKSAELPVIDGIRRLVWQWKAQKKTISSVFEALEQHGIRSLDLPTGIEMLVSTLRDASEDSKKC